MWPNADAGWITSDAIGLPGHSHSLSICRVMSAPRDTLRCMIFDTDNYLLVDTIAGPRASDGVVIRSDLLPPKYTWLQYPGNCRPYSLGCPAHPYLFGGRQSLRGLWCTIHAKRSPEPT